MNMMQNTKSQGIDKMNTNFSLFKMSIPIFVELMLQLLVGNIDQIMISRYSQNSVAAIVNGNQIMNLVIIVLNMVSIATTVSLSKFLGAKDEKNISKTCMVSLTMITCISIVITAIVLVLSKPVFRIMNVEDAVMNEAWAYIAIVATFIIVQGLYLNFAAILRAYTLMNQVMYVSIVMNVLNIAGNAVLINGLFGMPRLGIVGAAISTVISKTIGLILMIWIFRRSINIKLGLQFLRPFPTRIFVNICKIAIPSGVESFSYNFSQLGILGFVNIFGAMVTATKGYCSILANFSYVYAIAISEATQILVGYMQGANMIHKIEKRVWSTLCVCFSICVGMTILIYFNCGMIMQIFTTDPEVVALAKRILFIEIFLEMGRAVNILLTRILITVGDINFPMIIGTGGQWVIAFALSYVFGVVLNMGLEGIWIAMMLDECARGIIYVIRFKMGRWRKKVA